MADKKKIIRFTDEAMELAYQAYSEFQENSELSELHWARQRRGQSFQEYVEDAKYVWTQRGIEQGIERGIEQGIERGIEQGIERGIEQGIEQGIEKTARAMLSEGLSTDQIVRLTGLSAEEVESLKR